MRVVLQRVARAEVRIEGEVVGRIGRGYVVLAGFTDGDDEDVLRWIAEKIVQLRLFPADPPADLTDGPETLEFGSITLIRGASSFARSLADIGGDILVVSQFTLYADARKGRRPSFSNAAPPDVAAPLYERFVALLREHAPGRVETGRFGAMMDVDLVNDGPVTLVLER